MRLYGIYNQDTSQVKDGGGSQNDPPLNRRGRKSDAADDHI